MISVESLKAFFIAAAITGCGVAIFHSFEVVQALYLFLVAPTLLAGLDALGVPGLGTRTSGFFVPSLTGFWLSALLCWLLFFLILRPFFSSRQEQP